MAGGDQSGAGGANGGLKLSLSSYILALAIMLALAIIAQPVHAAEPPAQSSSDAQAVQRCQALAGGGFTGLPNAATYVTDATYVAPQAAQPAYCSVSAYVNPTVGFGLWLPTAWNGKYVVRGCGGSCGQIAMALVCTDHLRHGYACLTTDMGHKSSQVDNTWAAGNLQGQVDFAFRATHVATVAGKAILKAYYDRDPRWSYFYGCSTGGRQGMIEAQRYPEDFDGVFSMAPANMGYRTVAQRALGAMFDRVRFNADAAGRTILPVRKVPMIHRAVIAQCDLNDGIKDGLIGDPRACRFDPASLQCKGGDERGCLTAAQVGVVREIYAHTALLPGSELAWINDIVTDAPPQAAGAAPRGDPNVFPILYEASNPDLRAFKAHGGKMISAQGWADNQINPLSIIDYYELATRTLGGPAQTADFYRLFMVPGVAHCAGGDGPYAVDYMAALEAWVEQGRAPDLLTGRHPKLGAVGFSSADPAALKRADVVFSRPIYPYPKMAVYAGKGDPDLAASYVARDPPGAGP